MKLRIHIIDFLLNLYHNKGILAMFTFTINIKPYPIVGVSNMLLTTNQTSLLVYEALASDIRLKIIDRLFEKEMNIKELAAELYLSNAIVSSHVAKLEKAGIVGSKMKRINGGTYKMCYINTEHMQIKLSPIQHQRSYEEVSIPVGQYSNHEAQPTCGLATTEKMIGHYDDPVYFLDPEHVHASILWFARGFVEYKIPNYVHKDQQLVELEISMEIGSEAPQVNEHWPSDISFYVNNRMLGTWTSPGDFGEHRGRLTPVWWQSDVNQYGMLKVLRINESGTYIDGKKISEVTLSSLMVDAQYWTFRISAEELKKGRGGLTLYGKGFGNYDQDIVIRSYYKS